MTKYINSTNLKKTLDKRGERVYNGIVNSKGAVDSESTALFFWFIVLIPYTRGCMKSFGTSAPF